MNLYAEDCVIVDNNMYMVAYSINLIYRVDLETDAIEIIGPCIISLKGGMGGTYVRTTGEEGQAVLYIKASNIEEKKIYFNVSIVK